MKTIRERIDAYTKEKYGIDPEILPSDRQLPAGVNEKEVRE